MNKREVKFPELINKYGYTDGVEVGVYKGYFSKILLEKSKIRTLYCVDLWEDDSVFKTAILTLEKWIKSRNCVLMKKNSVDAASDFLDKSLNYVYLDGDHSLEGIYNDLRIWIKKIKIGGMLSGHDYKDKFKSSTLDYNKNFLPNRVKTIVDDFVQRYGYKLYLTEEPCRSWYFIKTHEAINKLNIRLNF